MYKLEMQEKQKRETSNNRGQTIGDGIEVP